METEIDNWVNHDFWYTNQCIDHYDDTERLTAMDLALPDPTNGHISHVDSSAATSPIAGLSPASVSSLPKATLDGLLGAGEESLSNAVPSINVDQHSVLPALYIVANEGMLVANHSVPLQSPTIPIQGHSLSMQSPSSSYGKFFACVCSFGVVFLLIFFLESFLEFFS